MYDERLLEKIEHFLQSLEMMVVCDNIHFKAEVANMPDDQNLISLPGYGDWSIRIGFIESYYDLKKYLAQSQKFDAESKLRKLEKEEKLFLDRTTR